MKRMKKLIAAIAGALLMVMPMIASPMMVNAASNNLTKYLSWDRYDGNFDIVKSVVYPVEISTNEDYLAVYNSTGNYRDMDDYSDWVRDMWEKSYGVDSGAAKGCYNAYGFIGLYPGDYFREGDTITFTLPFYGNEVVYLNLQDGFEFVSVSGNKFTVKCLKESDNIDFELVVKKGEAPAESIKKTVTKTFPWDRLDENYDSLSSGEFPVEFTTDEDFKFDYAGGYYQDLADYSDEGQASWESSFGLETGVAKDCYYLSVYFERNGYFSEGDTYIFTLPFYAGEVLYSNVDAFCSLELVSVSGNKLTLKSTGETNFYSFEMVIKKGSASDAAQDQFWFKPMKTQLNIAAEVASTTGKEAVAEASGDFSLSYEIMKWLEDHPNVTLKYALTYKGIDYNIVIKGGQKLADPQIPWYGPEYLIGKFGK
ncbi:MAG: hypothetical protein IKP92_04875 [Lachnospiraceae bacterium]|nr:hypothetical protein [Lachnospiraceae bacterium]